MNNLPMKRSFSESSGSGSSTIQISKPLIKKVRISAKNTRQQISIDSLYKKLESTQEANDVLQLLIQISDYLQICDEFELTEGIKKLSQYFKTFNNETTVRVKVLSLFAEISVNENLDSNLVADSIINLLQNENSAKVITQSLLSLHKIGNRQTDQHSINTLQLNVNAHVNKLVNFAKSQLVNPSHNVQRNALLILGAFALPSENQQELINLIASYINSQDSRVRAQAFRSILTLAKREFSILPNLYDCTSSSLTDDYECVRTEALSLIYELGVRHPDVIILVAETESQMRLIDAAFTKICSLLCDVSIHVRQQAATLLGGMHQVGIEFLHQTLDKKLMSNLRKKKSLHERSTEHFTSGEWATGKKWSEDVPKEVIEYGSASLIASGACGALVHGLEDEFLEVRSAAVDSMCLLALSYPSFALQSLDFLVDMFNDEIEEVRLKAIYSLTAISRHIVLREDQLEIMLSSLEDYSVEVREGLHIMLGACKVSTQSCLLMVVHKVLNVLSQYPQDKLSAFSCMQRIGQKHSQLCMSLTPQLLQDHPFFDSAERDVEDPAYICLLIMLFNAAEHLKPMLSLFSDVTIKHYAYLRDTMPKLVPYLSIDGTSRISLQAGSTGSHQFLKTILTNIQSAYSSTSARSALLKAAHSNLNQLAKIEPDLSGTAHFTVTFLGAQLLIEQLSRNQNQAPSKISLTQLMKYCLKLQNLFSGLTTNDLLLVKQISLRASALHLVLIVKDRSQSALGPCQLLMHIASDISHFLTQQPNIIPDSFTTSILNQLINISDPKPGRVFREILPIVTNAPPIITPQININIKMCTGVILEPSPSDSVENILKVTAGLVAALPFVADIFSLQEDQRKHLRLKIKYPDQNVHLVVPRMRDLKQIMTEKGVEETNWRLRTTVLLSHGVWTESSQIDIILCLSVRPGTELELCRTSKMFAPKPVRRGI